MVKLVLFDIGNVLIEWQPERYFDRIMPVATRQKMFAEVDLHGINDGIDRGGNFRDIIYSAADQYPEFADQIRLWHDDWLELATPAIVRSVGLSRALRAAGVETAILSNIGVETYELAAGRYPFLAEFDRHYISAHMRCIKPEAEIYAMVEADCGLAPDQLLFADDRAENIAAATARGWHGHHFENAEGWAASLVEHGLLSKQQAGLES